MVEVTVNFELREIWWLNSPLTCRSTQNLIVDIAYNIEMLQNLMVEDRLKQLKNAKPYGWNYRKYRRVENLMVEDALIRWRTKNLMVEVYSKTLNYAKSDWLKLPKSLKYAKSDRWTLPKIFKGSKSDGWSSTKTLKNAKSDGWSCL